MRLTRLGLKAIFFYGMLIVAFFVAPYLNLYFLLLGFLTVLAGLDAIWAWRNISGIRGELTEVSPMPARIGQAVRLLIDAGGRPRYQVCAELELAEELDGKKRVPLAKGANLEAGEAGEAVVEVAVEAMLPGMPRGIHPIRRAVLYSTYPLGLLHVRRRLEAQAELVVYPEPADLTGFRDQNGCLTDLGAVGGSHVQEMGPAGLREYRTGDELRRVHWKASARSRGLVVKELEGDSTPGIEVRLDLRAEDEALEHALSLTAALFLYCQENKQLFTLHSQDHRATYGEGHRPAVELWTYLASVQGLPAGAAPPPTVSPETIRLPLTVGKTEKPS